MAHSTTTTYATTTANLAAPEKHGRMGSMEGAASTTAKGRAQHHLTVARSRCSSHAPEVRAVCNGAASPSAPAAYGNMWTAKPGVLWGADICLAIAGWLFDEVLEHVQGQAREAGVAANSEHMSRFPSENVQEELCISDIR
jgi:hypothetical protein